MFNVRSILLPLVFFSALSLLQACSESGDSAAPTAPVAAPPASDGNADAEASAEMGDVAEIDPDSLELAGQVELKQYSVAWGGSGTSIPRRFC